jgi:restriction endonuclease Mrr
MGIDGIGSSTSPSNLEAPSSLESAEVRLEPTVATRSDAPAPITPTESGLLQQLEQGQLTREQYLERRIEEAVAPFANKLAPEQLEHVRQTLREQLQFDPTVLELIRRATEHVGG